MKNKIHDENMDRLFSAILELDSVEECYDFFTDLCTVSELRAMSQRLEVAFMLAGKAIYSDIAEKTGASTATISRVNRCLQYGSDGYRKILERMKKENT